MLNIVQIVLTLGPGGGGGPYECLRGFGNGNFGNENLSSPGPAQILSGSQLCQPKVVVIGLGSQYVSTTGTLISWVYVWVYGGGGGGLIVSAPSGITGAYQPAGDDPPC